MRIMVLAGVVSLAGCIGAPQPAAINPPLTPEQSQWCLQQAGTAQPDLRTAIRADHLQDVSCLAV